jgi:hypothetical protein
MKSVLSLLLACCLPLLSLSAAAADLATTLQQRLDAGETQIRLPAGRFQISHLTIPAGVTLSGAHDTILELTGNGAYTPIITLQGDNITLHRLQLTVAESLIKPLRSGALKVLVSAKQCRNLTLSELSFKIPDALYQQLLAGKNKRYVKRWNVIKAKACTDVLMSRCRATNFSQMLDTEFCTRVTVRDCVARNGIYLTKFSFGSEYLKHTNNWSTNVLHQMFWEGGDCSTAAHLNPRKPRTVIRGIRPGDAGYSKLLTGTYEVMCTANYAEYGKTLCWGRKGRRVLVRGNSARFMTDMAYDAEGCEEVIFANNIAVNCKASGIGCFYYTDAAIITGNTIIVNDEGDDLYKGHFVRMHHRLDTESGKTIITGNLFVNRLAKPRFIKVDKCRDLLIDGNKFVNGGILTNRYGGGNMTFTGNTFLSTLPEQETLVDVGKIVKELTMRQNTFINRNPDAKPGGPAINLEFTVTPKLARERPDAVEVPVFRQLDGNSIRGWSVPVQVTTAGQTGTGTIIFSNNLYEGVPSLPSSFPGLINQNNIQLDGPELK